MITRQCCIIVWVDLGLVKNYFYFSLQELLLLQVGLYICNTIRISSNLRRKLLSVILMKLGGIVSERLLLFLCGKVAESIFLTWFKPTQIPKNQNKWPKKANQNVLAHYFSEWACAGLSLTGGLCSKEIFWRYCCGEGGSKFLTHWVTETRRTLKLIDIFKKLELH